MNFKFQIKYFQMSINVLIFQSLELAFYLNNGLIEC